jgi:hypothetical protein
MTTIAKGVVRIDGKDNTQKAFKSVKKNADKMAVALKAAAVGLAAIAAVRGMAKSVKTTLDYADAIGKVATRTGMTTEYVQLWTKALGESGITETQSQKGLVTFGKRLAEMKDGYGAMLGPISKYSEELANQMKNASSVQEANDIFIRALENTKDPALQAALAAAAYDTELGKMIASSLTAPGAMKKTQDKYKETSTILTEEQIRMAETANDSMAQMSDAWTTAKHSIIVEAAEPIIAIMRWMLETGVPLMRDFGQAIGYAWETYGKPGMDLMIDFFKTVWSIVGPFIDAMVVGVQAAFKLIGFVYEEFVKPGFDAFQQGVESLWGVVGPIFDAGAQYIGTAMESTFAFFQSALSEIEQWVNGTQTFIETMKGVWDSFKVHLETVINAMITFFSGLIQPAKDAWESVKGIWNNAIGWIQGKIEALTGLLPDWMNPFAKSAKESSAEASKEVGKASMSIGVDLLSIKKEADNASAGFISSMGGIISSGVQIAQDFGSNVVGFFTKAWQSIVASADEGEKGVTEAGERINKKAFRNTWAKDFLKYVPGYYDEAFGKMIYYANEADMEMYRSGKAITDNAAEQAAERAKIAAGEVENTSYTYKSMVDLSEGFVNDLGGVFENAFTKLFEGDIKGAWETLLDGMKDMAIKTASQIAAAWAKDLIFGGGGNAGKGIFDKILGGSTAGGSAGGGMGGITGILGKIGSLFKGGTSSGVVASGSTSSGIVGSGATATAGGGMSAMAGFAAPLAIFAFGMAKSMKDAKKNKAEYDAILADTVMKEKMASEEITSGYVTLGEQGGQTYAQLSGDMAKHMEKVYGNVDAINGNTDAYGNMVVKVTEFDDFMNDVKWQETTLGHLDSVKELEKQYGKMGVTGQEATLTIDMALTAVINQEKEAKIYAEIMEAGFVSAAQALEIGLPKAAGKSAEELQNMVNASNAARNGVANLSADAVGRLGAIDSASLQVARSLEDGMVTAAESSSLGFASLQDMTSEMFLAMIEYAKQASNEMNDLARAANNAGAAAANANKSRMPGYMTGGSFMVGGQGGLDNNIVAFKASNNERVTVETPQQQAVNNRGQQSSANMTADLIEFVTKPLIKEMRKQSIIQASNERH